MNRSADDPQFADVRHLLDECGEELGGSADDVLSALIMLNTELPENVMARMPGMDKHKQKPSLKLVPSQPN